MTESQRAELASLGGASFQRATDIADNADEANVEQRLTEMLVATQIAELGSRMLRLMELIQMAELVQGDSAAMADEFLGKGVAAAAQRIEALVPVIEGLQGRIRNAKTRGLAAEATRDARARGIPLLAAMKNCLPARPGR